MLEHTPRPEVWPSFFAKHNLPNFGKKEIHSAEHFFMLDQAITAGLGIAMIPKFLVIDKIESGELINPLNITMKTKVVFSLLYLKQKKDRRKIEVFSKWIKEVARKTEALL